MAFGASLAGAQAPKAPTDPTKDEIEIPALGNWRGTLVYENDVGIWTVEAMKAYPLYGCPELVGLDDKGRCTIFMSYSGKWTPFQTVEDREWLGAVVQTDLDPRLPGVEMYTGGKRGNLYQIQPYAGGGCDARIIARFPALEIHTLSAGDLLASRPGNELLCFTLSGEAFDIRPDAEAPGGFRAVQIAKLPGRVRQALVLPAEAGTSPWIATASRAGEVALVRMEGDGLAHRPIHRDAMGFGRIALRPLRPGTPLVLYATRDDGVVVRLQQGARLEDEWTSEVIYAGPQGLRGIAAGRFMEDPNQESVAVFGYGKRVQVLARGADGQWVVEDAFEDRDKGHWLTAAELDGRNGTDEIVCSGYGSRIIQLSRPPGYGRKGVAIDTREKQAAKPASASATAASRPADATGPRAPRIAVAAGPVPPEGLSTLSYRGGFETKTLVYETLVRRDERGRIVPALASSWQVLDDGRVFVFRLREGATFHDGTPVDAEAVRLHFRRWVGLPEHAWLRSSRYIQSVEAPSPLELRVTLDRPWSLLSDLCAINPCGIRAPGCVSREGLFVRPLGSGPFKLGDVLEDGVVRRYERHGRAGGPAFPALDLVACKGRAAPEILAELREGRLDAVVNGWADLFPGEQLRELAIGPGLKVVEAPGSAVQYLSFRMDGGPTSRLEVRKAVAAAVDRAALVAEVMDGRADPCTSWAAATVEMWPRGAAAPRAAGTPPAIDAKMRLIVPAGDRRQVRLGTALAGALGRAGLPTECVEVPAAEMPARVRSGEFDLRIETTWGVPYDPDLSLAARFLPSTGPHAAEERSFGVEPGLADLVGAALAEPDERARAAHYARIQAWMDGRAAIVPLFVPRRLAVVRPEGDILDLDHDLYRLRFRGPGSETADGAKVEAAATPAAAR